MTSGAQDWYSVRCVFQWNSWEDTPFEERITLWQADSLEKAMALAEVEAAEYADSNGVAYLHLAQEYALDSGTAPRHGSEVFSLLRGSDLTAEDYLGTFFDTGSEHIAIDKDETAQSSSSTS